MRNRTIAILSVASIIMFMLSMGCATDWIINIQDGKDWSGNLFFHPFTGFLLIGFIIALGSIVLKERSKSLSYKIKSDLHRKKTTILALCSFVGLLSGIGVIITSINVLESTIEGRTPNSVIIPGHFFLNILFIGSIILMGLFLWFTQINEIYVESPAKFQMVFDGTIITSVLISLGLLITYGLMSGGF